MKTAGKDAWNPKSELKRHQTEVLLFMSLYFFPSVWSLGLDVKSDWHCNHRRVFWHKIRLFVDAEHSGEFIFIQCISSVTYSEDSDSENTLWALLAVEVHQSIQIITVVAIWHEDGLACKETTLVRADKTASPQGKMHNTYFNLSFYLPIDFYFILFHMVDFPRLDISITFHAAAVSFACNWMLIALYLPWL